MFQQSEQRDSNPRLVFPIDNAILTVLKSQKRIAIGRLLSLIVARTIAKRKEQVVIITYLDGGYSAS